MTIRSYLRPKLKFAIVTIVVACSVTLIITAYFIPVMLICFARWCNEEPIDFMGTLSNVIRGEL